MLKRVVALVVALLFSGLVFGLFGLYTRVLRTEEDLTEAQDRVDSLNAQLVAVEAEAASLADETNSIERRLGTVEGEEPPAPAIPCDLYDYAWEIEDYLGRLYQNVEHIGTEVEVLSQQGFFFFIGAGFPPNAPQGPALSCL